jgi:hypothetical protein
MRGIGSANCTAGDAHIITYTVRHPGSADVHPYAVPHLHGDADAAADQYAGATDGHAAADQYAGATDGHAAADQYAGATDSDAAADQYAGATDGHAAAYQRERADRSADGTSCCGHGRC